MNTYNYITGINFRPMNKFQMVAPPMDMIAVLEKSKNGELRTLGARIETKKGSLR